MKKIFFWTLMVLISLFLINCGKDKVADVETSETEETLMEETEETLMEQTDKDSDTGIDGDSQPEPSSDPIDVTQVLSDAYGAVKNVYGTVKNVYGQVSDVVTELSRPIPEDLLNEDYLRSYSDKYVVCEKGEIIVTYILYIPGIVDSSNVCELDTDITPAPNEWRSQNDMNYCSKKLDELILGREGEGYTCHIYVISNPDDTTN